MSKRPLQQPLSDKVLILSDGKPGHVNQSIAFARLLDLDYIVRKVSMRNRFSKALMYLADRCNLSLKGLFNVEGDFPQCPLVVSAGSETYYPNRVLAKAMGARSVAIMLPKGFRYDFDLIVAQQHDQPPERKNILSLPVNLSFPEPQGLVARSNNKQCVSLIIGGSSRHFRIDVNSIEKQMQQIFTLFPGADFMATTSRRTPPEIEALVEQGPFRYKVIASKEQTNPIPDFLAISDYVFVTEDSTSMISEAVSFGKSNVEVLSLNKIGSSGKIERMILSLEQNKYLHVFDGKTDACNKKINLAAYLQEACQ